MNTSKLGRDFIARNEWNPRSSCCGWDETKQLYFPYRDYKGFPTIGVGHLIKAGEDFSAGRTEEQIDELFGVDLGKTEEAIDRFVSAELERRKQPPLQQHEYDALADFGHNCGYHALDTVRNSATRALVQGRRDLVPTLLLPWDISAGKHDPGLRNRRKAEGYLFTHPYPAEAIELPAPLIDLMPLIREINDERWEEDLKARE